MKNIYSILFCLILIQSLNAQQKDSLVYTRFYYPDSSLSSEGWMRGGQPDAYWKSYYPNGVLRSEGLRKNFLLDSVWSFYNEKGEIEMTITYSEGRKHGLRRIYTEDEIIEVDFLLDTIRGFENHYSKQGHLLQSIPYEKGLPEGMAKEFDTLGNILAVTVYKKGYVIKRENVNRTDFYQMKQGSWKYFWDNGNLKMEGYYVNNKKHGFFKYYNEEGVFLQIEKWENDELKVDALETKQLEKQVAFHPNGKIKTEAYFFQGKPEGIRREYDTSGAITKAYVFKNARLTGEGIVDENGWKQGAWKEFYEEDAALKAEGNYKDNRTIGDWKYYFPDGKIEITGRYTNKGEKDGEWIWYYPDGKIVMIENYFNGVYDGVVVSFDEKGDTLVYGKYQEGLEEGRWMYKNDSVIVESYYLEGQKHGNWKTYYANGQLKISSRFEHDFLEGKTIYYWENGRRKYEYNYLNGLLHGNAYTYDEEGNHQFTTTYDMGVEVAYGGVKITPVLDK